MRRSNKKDSKAYEDYLNFENDKDSEQRDTSNDYRNNELEETDHENYSDFENKLMNEIPEMATKDFSNDTNQYSSHKENQHQFEETSTQTYNGQEDGNRQLNDESLLDVETEFVPKRQRARYSAKVDRFLTNGIIVVTVLLIAILLIAFLV